MGGKSITIVRPVTADIFFDNMAAEVPSDEWIRDVPWGVHRMMRTLWGVLGLHSSLGNGIVQLSWTSWPHCGSDVQWDLNRNQLQKSTSTCYRNRFSCYLSIPRRAIFIISS
jgi:hypothetical protein